MTQSRSPINWVNLNRLTYLAVQDDRIVGVAHWEPEGPAVINPDDPAGTPEPIITEPAFVLTRSDDVHGKTFGHGPEPAGEWPNELIWRAGRLWREWPMWPDGLPDGDPE